MDRVQEKIKDTTKLLQAYPKSANLPNECLGKYAISTQKEKRWRSTTDEMDGSICLTGRL
jgi:hypothetical protein